MGSPAVRRTAELPNWTHLPNRVIPTAIDSDEERDLEEVEENDDGDSQPPLKKRKTTKGLAAGDTSLFQPSYGTISPTEEDNYDSMNKLSEQLAEALNKAQSGSGHRRSHVESRRVSGASHYVWKTPLSQFDGPTAASSSKEIALVSRGDTGVSGFVHYEPPSAALGSPVVLGDTENVTNSPGTPMEPGLPCFDNADDPFSGPVPDSNESFSSGTHLGMEEDDTNVRASPRKDVLITPVSKRRKKDDEPEAYEADLYDLEDWFEADVSKPRVLLDKRGHKEAREQLINSNLSPLRKAAQAESSVGGYETRREVKNAPAVAIAELPQSVRVNNLIRDLFGEDATTRGFSRPKPVLPTKKAQAGNIRATSPLVVRPISPIYSTSPSPKLGQEDVLQDLPIAGTREPSTNDSGISDGNLIKQEVELQQEAQNRPVVSGNVSDDEQLLPSGLTPVSSPRHVSDQKPSPARFQTTTRVPMFRLRDDLLGVLSAASPLGSGPHTLTQQSFSDEIPVSPNAIPRGFEVNPPSTRTATPDLNEMLERKSSPADFELISPMVLEMQSSRAPSPTLIVDVEPHLSSLRPSSIPVGGQVSSAHSLDVTGGLSPVMKDLRDFLSDSSREHPFTSASDSTATQVVESISNPTRHNTPTPSAVADPVAQRLASDGVEETAPSHQRPPTVDVMAAIHPEIDMYEIGEQQSTSRYPSLPCVLDPHYLRLRYRDLYRTHDEIAFGRAVAAQAVVAELNPDLVVWGVTEYEEVAIYDESDSDLEVEEEVDELESEEEARIRDEEDAAQTEDEDSEEEKEDANGNSRRNQKPPSLSQESSLAVLSPRVATRSSPRKSGIIQPQSMTSGKHRLHRSMSPEVPLEVVTVPVATRSSPRKSTSSAARIDEVENSPSQTPSRKRKRDLNDYAQVAVSSPRGFSTDVQKWTSTLRMLLKGKKRLDRKDLLNLKSTLEDIFTSRTFVRPSSTLADLVYQVSQLEAKDIPNKDEMGLRPLARKSAKAWGIQKRQRD